VFRLLEYALEDRVIGRELVYRVKGVGMMAEDRQPHQVEHLVLALARACWFAERGQRVFTFLA
jgi:hypothetical protein